MRTRLGKWGRGLGVRIPTRVAKKMGLENGTSVEITVRNRCIEVRPTNRIRYELSDLVRQIKPSNRHNAVETSKNVGREIW